MSERPWMPVYVGDYETDTNHLTCEEDGAYWRLLRKMWVEHGRLPNIETTLARVCGLTVKRWRKIAPAVMPFFTIVDGYLEQKRVSEELDKAHAISRKRSAAGKQGGRSKRGSSNRFEKPQLVSKQEDVTPLKPLINGHDDEAKAKQKSVTTHAPARDTRARPASQGQSQSQSPMSLTSFETPSSVASQLDDDGSNFALTPPPARRSRTKVAPIPKFADEFDEWYAEFPNHVGKADARKKFAKARQKVALDVLLEGVRRYVASKPADQSWCHPSTWLHKERWEDEPAEIAPSAARFGHQATAPPGVDFSDENMRAIGARLEARFNARRK